VRKIVTENINPPIPSRSFDWTATYENWDLDDIIGMGETEAKAIQNLKEQDETYEN
jgi:hypothetical protein